METGTLYASEASVAGLNLYAKFQIQFDTGKDKAAYTTSDGYCYAIVNGYIQPATDPTLTAKYATAKVHFAGWFSDETCNTGATADQLARIAQDAGLSVWVAGGARARASLIAPTVEGDSDESDGTHLFNETFGNTLNNRVEVPFVFNAGGGVKTGQDTLVYIAISGDSSLVSNASMSSMVAAHASTGFADDGTYSAGAPVNYTVTIYGAAS